MFREPETTSRHARQPDWKALREEFPTLAHWNYLDVARKTIAPRCQERALQEYIRDVYENAGADAWAATNIAETRTLLAQLLGAKPSEIAFTKNTTEGLNIAAHASASMRSSPGQSPLRTCASASLRARWEPAPNTPEEFRKMIASELQRWAQVIKEAGIRQE